jgi:hypothetical protein
MRTTSLCIGGIRMNPRLEFGTGEQFDGAISTMHFQAKRKRTAALIMTSALVVTMMLVLLPSSGCSQKCGACNGREGMGCTAEMADAATCPSDSGLCALQGKCMCAKAGCDGVAGAECNATNEPSCNTVAGCSWVTFCNFVFPCGNYDNQSSCNAQQACMWDPSNGCS